MRTCVQFFFFCSSGDIFGLAAGRPDPSPEGTEIRVRISHASTTFTARGSVVFVFPNMGMGVAFKSVEDNQLAVLQEWLSKLSRGE